MSFTTTIPESLPGAVRRRAAGQLARAIAGLRDPRLPLADGIHDMRTSIKKVRAWISLVQSHAPKKARRADRRLRALASKTSTLRDAEVALRTWQTLLAESSGAKSSALSVPATSAPALAGVRRRLKSHLRAAERACESQRQVETLISRLKRERRRVRVWVPRHDAEWTKLWRGPCVGLSKSYRRARRAMTVAARTRGAETFHDWRKAVKAHRYQLQFLQGLWPKEIGADASELERLGELLGDEHDLTMLRQVVVEQPEILPDETARSRVGALIDGRRAELREAALALGERLFQERARLFRRRLQERLHGEAPGQSHKAEHEVSAQGLSTVARDGSGNNLASRLSARAPFSFGW